ncbi:hypothetical protein [Virgisporangium aurantiacum]|uniref:Uncharacterized protein n=1 Tax=Virgisporangium aurantiacum TaxID=175570 RepID=A0A8J4E727_9ACTN|nr:hypothetical protein [Virgisporangium aurantiacum]GIJ63733.1 hypothetical protein Vau01_112490 [Virgisporangium aurantiacum]
MTGVPREAARDLAVAEQSLRRGAELALPRSRWRYPGIVVLYTVWGATWDTPQAWRWIPPLASVAALLIVTGPLSRRRARPLPIPLGWRTWLLTSAIATTSVAISLGMGLALQTLGVPLPFTLSGLCLGVAASLVTWRSRYWGIGYVQQVTRGKW